MSTRGYVTIATGDIKYYEMAFQLLHSYRVRANSDLPFAILSDRENDYTRAFDQAVLMRNANCSYMDKLLLYQYSPYDETIFIDADSLVLADLKGLWEDFSTADDMSCYGAVYPLNSDRAWFSYEGCGRYREDIHFLVDLHGGVYFLRKTDRCRVIFEQAIALTKEYNEYGFKNFEKPADEPVLAMSMAIHKCRPCQKPMRLLFVPSYWGKLRVNVAGELLVAGKKQNVEIVHFATANTQRFIYHYLVEMLDTDTRKKGKAHNIWRFIYIHMLTAPKEISSVLRHFTGKILRRFLPKAVVNKLKAKR